MKNKKKVQINKIQNKKRQATRDTTVMLKLKTIYNQYIWKS